jgi:hypothetical protein
MTVRQSARAGTPLFSLLLLCILVPLFGFASAVSPTPGGGPSTPGGGPSQPGGGGACIAKPCTSPSQPGIPTAPSRPAVSTPPSQPAAPALPGRATTSTPAKHRAGKPKRHVIPSHSAVSSLAGPAAVAIVVAAVVVICLLFLWRRGGRVVSEIPPARPHLEARAVGQLTPRLVMRSTSDRSMRTIRIAVHHCPAEPRLTRVTRR